MSRKKIEDEIKKNFSPYKINEMLLDEIFKKAMEEGKVLWPDNALRELAGLYEKHNEIKKEAKDKVINENPSMPTISVRVVKERVMRKAHEYAFGLFYKHYIEKKKGAPPISDKELEEILSLSEQGLSYGEIAIKLGWPTSPIGEALKSKDKVRHRVKTAKKRLR